MNVVEAIVLTAVLYVLAAMVKPDHARCPDRWYVDGVTSSGRFGCRPIPPPEPAVRGHEKDAPPRHDPEIYSTIYCTGGSHPIVVDEKTVGCQR